MDTQNEAENEDRKISITKKRLKSVDLFVDTKELIIVHNDEEYKLRITGNKKLILTK